MSSDLKIGLTLASILGFNSLACFIAFFILFHDPIAWALWAIGIIGALLTAKVINDLSKGV